MNQSTYPVTGGITTEELARAIGGKPASIRVRLCTHGSYYGIKPAKLPNGRLLWPHDAVEQLIEASSRKNG